LQKEKIHKSFSSRFKKEFSDFDVDINV
jgi:hypothetical protein